MKKILFLLIATLIQATPAFAAPLIDFSFAGLSNPGPSSTTFMDVVVNAFVYTTPSGIPTYTDSHLWQRNDSPSDHGFGVCSEGASCTTGGGDVNELDNLGLDEIIRLTLPTGKKWTDVFVSSLDSSEQGTLYWSNGINPVLSGAPHVAYSAALFGTPDEGSILSLLQPTGTGWQTAKYLYFRAGDPENLIPNTGTDNDYLVWGVNMAPIPEPEIYAMMGIGLALMGFVARRKKLKEGATA